MPALLNVQQLPDHIAQLERQRELLDIATGFSISQKQRLIARYDALIAEAIAILQE